MSSTTDERSFTWPIVTISQGVVAVVRDEARFTTATKTAVENGYFDDMWIVDNLGRGYRVRGCQVVNEPYWRRPKTAFGRGVRLRGFVVEGLGAHEFAEVRERVIKAVEADKSFWEAALDSSAFIERLRDAADVPTLMRTLAVKD